MTVEASRRTGLSALPGDLAANTRVGGHGSPTVRVVLRTMLTARMWSVIWHRLAHSSAVIHIPDHPLRRVKRCIQHIIMA